jgi:hypothetical protein
LNAVVQPVNNSVPASFGRAFSGCKSNLVEGAGGFEIVEFFGFPIHGEFQHGQAIGGGVERFQLRGQVQIGQGFRGRFIR